MKLSERGYARDYKNVGVFWNGMESSVIGGGEVPSPDSATFGNCRLDKKTNFPAQLSHSTIHSRVDTSAFKPSTITLNPSHAYSSQPHNTAIMQIFVKTREYIPRSPPGGSLATWSQHHQSII